MTSTLHARILAACTRDSIDLSVLPFADEALSSITSLAAATTSLPPLDFSAATRIDTHTHPVPSWFRALAPQAAGRDTPEWSPSAHLSFMATHAISRSVLSVSTPQANAFTAERDVDLRRAKTRALARLLNEFVAELCRVFPARFRFMAILPLPDGDASVVEARHALDTLGALGVALLSNHEGLYPGDPAFEPLWTYLQSRANSDTKQVVFLHPTDSVLRLPSGEFINANPSPLRAGLGDFYFETARAVSSLTACLTLARFPALHYRVSHGAGAFPDVSARFLLSLSAADAQAAREAYRTRFWYDSAGPVWPAQIRGVLDGMGVSVEQCVFGSDWPFGVGFWSVDDNIAGLMGAAIEEGEKEGVYWGNARRLWGRGV